MLNIRALKFNGAAVTILFLIGLLSGIAEGSGGGKLMKVEDRSHVCMVNDVVMGKPQIPVQVEDETYYGCCKMCIGKLKNGREARFAIDPVTKREVDKAKAVIGALSSGDVYYFESEETFTAFSNK